MFTAGVMVHAFNQSREIEVVDVVACDDVWIFIANHGGHLFHNQVFSTSVFVDAARAIEHVFNPYSCTENRIVGNARFQIVGKNTPWNLERLAFCDILKLDRNGAINLVSTNTTMFDDSEIALPILILMFSLINQKAINGKVHTNVVVQEHSIDEGNITRVNRPSLLLQFTTK